jgi:hypothetical protein
MKPIIVFAVAVSIRVAQSAHKCWLVGLPVTWFPVLDFTGYRGGLNGSTQHLLEAPHAQRRMLDCQY